MTGLFHCITCMLAIVQKQIRRIYIIEQETLYQLRTWQATKVNFTKTWKKRNGFLSSIICHVIILVIVIGYQALRTSYWINSLSNHHLIIEKRISFKIKTRQKIWINNRTIKVKITQVVTFQSLQRFNLVWKYIQRSYSTRDIVPFVLAPVI